MRRPRLGRRRPVTPPAQRRDVAVLLEGAETLDPSGFTIEVDRAWLLDAKHRLTFAAHFEAEMVERGLCMDAVVHEARGSAALAKAFSKLLAADHDSVKARDQVERVERGFAVRTNAPGSRDDGRLFLVNGDESERRSHEGPTNWVPGQAVEGWQTTHDVYVDPAGRGGPGDAPSRAEEQATP